MKFFVIIPLSNFQPENSAYPYDAPDIPVPFHRLYQCCMNLQMNQQRGVDKIG